MALVASNRLFPAMAGPSEDWRCMIPSFDMPRQLRLRECVVWMPCGSVWRASACWHSSPRIAHLHARLARDSDHDGVWDPSALVMLASFSFSAAPAQRTRLSAPYHWDLE